MPLAADLLDRKRTQFVLWHPKLGATAGPVLVIGRFQAGNPAMLASEQRLALAPVAGFPDLFAINAANCNLSDGVVYHYWFEVEDSVYCAVIPWPTRWIGNYARRACRLRLRPTTASRQQ